MAQLKISRQIKVTFLLMLIMSQDFFLEKIAKIAPCSFDEDGCNDQIDVSFVRLDPTHDLMWEKEVRNTKSLAKDSIPPSRRNDQMIIMSEQDAWNRITTY